MQEAGIPALRDAEKENIRTKLQKDLNNQFESRINTDAETEKK